MYMNHFLFALLLVFLSTVVHASFIDDVLPPIPNGCQQSESGTLGSTDNFAYSFLICGSEHVVILEKFVVRKNKKAYWRIIDEVRILNSSTGLELIGVPLRQSSVYKGGYVFVLGSWRKMRNTYEAINVSDAWRFNLESQKIESISRKEVSCSQVMID